MAIYNRLTCHLFPLLSQAEQARKEPLQHARAELGDALGCQLLWPAWSLGPAEEIPVLPCLPPFAHRWEGFGMAWFIRFSGPPASHAGHVAGDLFHCSSFWDKIFLPEQWEQM